MVSIDQVRSANATFKQTKQRPNIVALFVGATSGIGMGTLKAFAANTTSPTIYVVGRSKFAAEPLLNELAELNPEAKVNFIETEISLIKYVDTACEQIKANEKHIDLLFLSPGYLSFEGRNESKEGIDIPHALRYYSRLRFVHNLLPLLKESKYPRVVSILAGGREGTLNFDDLEMKNNFNGFKAAGNGATQTTLAFEELAKSNSNITFIHKYPGFVDTGVVGRLLGTAEGILAVPATLAKWVILPVINTLSMSVDVAGERGFFIATSPTYPPSKPKVQLPPNDNPSAQALTPAKSSSSTNGAGNGVYLLNEKDESQPDAPVMAEYRANGASKKVWEDTQKVWSRALFSYAIST